MQELLCHYLMLNFLLAIGYLCSAALSNTFLRKKATFKQQLRITRFLLIYIPGVYFLFFLIKLCYWPEHVFLFQLPTLGTAIAHNMTGKKLNVIEINKFSVSDYLYLFLLVSIILVLVSRLIHFILQLIKLNKIICNSICVKCCNNLSIFVADMISSPFCFSFLKRSYIVMTADLVENYLNYRLAIKHELQHLRQKDTLWVYIFELFRIVFYLNPLVHLWCKRNLELQELACDEVLIKEKHVCSQDYASCLLAAAEHALNRKFLIQESFSAAVGLFHSKKSLTSRRITMLFQYRKSLNNRGLAFLISGLLSLIIVTAAYAVGVTGSHQTQKLLNAPLFTNNYLMKWSNEAVLKSFTYDYTNYKQNLERTSHYFIPEGWKNFMIALKSSGNLDTVVAKKLTVSAVSNSEPKIIRQGVENGRYAWHVKIPITITYLGENNASKQSVIVNLLIIRTDETANGIGIGQYTISPDGLEN